MSNKQAADVCVSMQGHVAIVEMRRPPHNFFDAALIAGLADAFEALEADPACRAIVLCSQGTAFCAGANLSRLEGRAAIPALLRRFPRIRLGTTPPKWRETAVLRGLESFPVSVN